ncbi:hypothetical protein SOCE26_010640 [Sorangium cellulosum]|uniref:Uncharacterized protein n=1 Tax=Sorangium cellulosum TaxID=56 RepID=A0A2L0EK63_SORCE|nr:hypothetical protein [Sorangium cellulosum]AUX39669.1 hypothetical protein SOCE26_010640 [Sorangium cellulosum]
MKWWAAVLLVACVAGCGVNPIPEPPLTPELVGDVVGVGCAACDRETIELAGGPGSVRNADVVWAVNLDGTAPPEVADVGVDGSFVLSLDAFFGDEVRLQARRGEIRSEPADRIVVEGVLESAPRPLADCFVVEPELALADTAVGEVSTGALRIEHGCAAPLSIDAITLRAPSADFSLQGGTAPVVLAPGEPMDLRVELRPSASGVREEVLLIEVSSPAAARRAVTLFGRGVP